jgi:hypothetical protein
MRHKWGVHNLPSCTACFLSPSVFLSRSLACDLSIPPSPSPSLSLSPSLSPVVRSTHVNSHFLTHKPSRPQAQRCWWQVTVLSSHAPAQPVSWQIDPSIYAETNSIMHIQRICGCMWRQRTADSFMCTVCVLNTSTRTVCVGSDDLAASVVSNAWVSYEKGATEQVTHAHRHTLTHIPPFSPFRHPFPPSDIRIERDSWLIICMTWWQSGSLQTLFIQCQMGRIAVAQILPGM